MKKLFAIILAVMLVLALLPPTASARTYPYYWTFDDTAVGSLPSGFTTAVVDSGQYDSFIAGHFPGGVAAAVDNWSSLPTGDCVFMGSWFTNTTIQANRWLITPALEISDENDVLRWSAKSQDPAFLDSYNVLISTSDNQPSSFTTTLLSVTDERGSWQQHYIDLGGYTGQTVYIAFRLVSLDKFLLLLDNIGLTDAVPSGALAVNAGSDQSVNLGNSATLTAAVSGGNPPYTYSWSDGVSAAGSTSSVTVSPETDTTYTCTITDVTGNTVSDSVAVTVLPALYTITATPGSVDFGSVTEGYDTAPEAQTVTIQNTGSQSVTLSASASANFDISDFSSSTVAKTETATFTVRPKADLPEGTYEETITISTDHDTSADITVSFTVSRRLTLSSSVSSGTIYTGGRITLTPSIPGGTWTFDSAYFSRDGGTFTALRAGTSTITYTVGSASVSYDVTIEESGLPSTGQDLAWVWVLAGAALALAAVAAGFRRKQTR